ncbi:MAG: CDP-glycerol glycerophosphotransferase family protein, partial [Kiritimatiellae bacterium]|nr:CDP-glycerol glycerophosphotransferase family protein [Kiritimatiellia bacterium]
QIDVMDEISNADILATDYSSLGFDFTFLRKPVLLYAQDLDIYRRERKFYCTQKEFENAAIQDPREFVKRLTSGDYPALNPFFAERMRIPDDETYAKVKDGYYIERMYEHFRKLQNETYAFLGYDFSGVGGTVFATKALAEGLLEAGKRVLLCPLKNGGTGSYPPGTVNRPMIDYTHLSIAVRLMCRLFNRKKHYSYLQYDKDMPNLRPYCGWALTRLMKNIHAKAVISTRETMHFFLDDATSPWIKEKFYYFHCNAGLLEGIFPGTIERLKRRCLDTALFVTERNKRALAELFGYRHYKRGVVTGNALNSSRMIDRRSVTAVTEKPRGFIVATLLRLGEERRADIERAVDFARYLKTKGQTRIRINVFGKGELVKWLQYLLVDEELDAIMAYRGETRDIVKTYKAHDAMVDFSRLQSFGMGYIEAVFNGRIPFCMHNEGSDEVLEGIPRCFYETNEELEAKILALPGVTIGELRGNYERLARRYSRAAVANHLVSVDRKTHRKIVFEFLDRIEDGARIVIFDSAPDSSPALIGSAGEIRLERRNDGLLQADIHPETDNWWIGVTPHARIETGRFFPCGRIYKNASFRIGRYVMFWDCDRLAFRKMSPVRQLWRRGLFWIELLCDRRTGARKAALARLAVVVLRLFKHRPLWLIADRLDAAGDNGEALFLHLRKNHPSLDVRFIVSSRTSTFRSLGTKGPVVASESPKRKILTLLSDCLISSQAERAFSNPFDGYSEPYRDLLAKIPIVFLQHGATKDDVSSKLGRRTRNFAGFVVSAVQERNSVVNGAYGYDTKQVWLTGLPRFDLLRPSPDAEKHILIMPTWRLSLMDGQTGPNHEWRLKNGFRKSGFFKFYDGLLSDKKLLNTCRRRGYAISFVLH